jgi:hypothetical protein
MQFDDRGDHTQAARRNDQGGVAHYNWQTGGSSKKKRKRASAHYIGVSENAL